MTLTTYGTGCLPGVRLLTFDCRDGGKTRLLGDPDKLTFDAFTDDLMTLPLIEAALFNREAGNKE